jgi:hypothetical protein
MPPNLYGVQAMVSMPVSGGPLSDQACAANTETYVYTSAPLIAVSPGWYYVRASFSLAISCGATPPTFITVGARINNGADFAQPAVCTQMLTANANFQVSFVVTNTPSSEIIWRAPGSTISIGINPQAQGVTVRQIWTFLTTELVRAPDQ